MYPRQEWLAWLDWKGNEMTNERGRGMMQMTVFPSVPVEQESFSPHLHAT